MSESPNEPRSVEMVRQLLAGPTLDLPDLESAVRPLLVAVAEIGNFDATYLTVIDWATRRQIVRFSHNVNHVFLVEGQETECSPEVTEFAFMGVSRWTGAVDEPTKETAQMARGLGVGSFSSVPVVTAAHGLYGRLCGASKGDAPTTDATISAMEFIARLISDLMARQDAARAVRDAQVAANALYARAGFLAEAEHKLKTPLTAITGWMELLQSEWRTASEEEIAEAIDVVDRNFRLLVTLVNRLLEESTADIRAQNLHVSRVNVGEAVRLAARAFVTPLATHDVVVDCGDDVYAEVDPTALYQVLGHLLDNAVKYSPSGTSIEIRIRQEPVRVEIDIRDHGTGIPLDVDVFAPFARGHTKAVETKPGVGLGLHIARKLVRAMNGELSARTNTDGGSTFTIQLPAN